MSYLPQQFYQEEAGQQPLKVELFTKISQLQGLTQQLAEVSEYNEVKRTAWLDEHELSLQQLMERFSQHLPVDLDDDRLDKESVDLLMEYSKYLQEMVTVVHSMLPGVK